MQKISYISIQKEQIEGNQIQYTLLLLLLSIFIISFYYFMHPTTKYGSNCLINFQLYLFFISIGKYIFMLILINLQNFAQILQGQLKIMRPYKRQSNYITPQKRNSTEKIQKLYVEFESLKTRLRSSSKKKYSISNQSQIQKYYFKNDCIIEDTRNNLSCVKDISLFDQIRVDTKSNITELQQRQGIHFFGFQQSFKTCIQHFILTKIEAFQQKCQYYLKKMADKVQKSQHLMSRLNFILATKKSTLNKMNKLRESKVNQYEESSNEKISSLIISYQQKINNIRQSYQSRLSNEYDKDKETFSSTIKIIQKKQSSFYQNIIMAKEGQLSKMRLELYKLRRSYDLLKSKYEKSVKVGSQLENSKNRHQKDKIAKDRNICDVQIQIFDIEKDNKIKCLQQQLLDLKDENKRLYIDLRVSDAQHLQELPHQNKQSSQESRNKDDLSGKSNQINGQFYTELSQIQPDQGSLNQFNNVKSQIISSKHKKSIAESLKNLELEVNLISQENKHLQSKKNYFQQQVKSSEMDEQRFQQQSLLLKAQMKRLNTTLRCLDEISFLFLTKGQLIAQKVQSLPQQIKSREAFLQKISKPHQHIQYK